MIVRGAFSNGPRDHTLFGDVCLEDIGIVVEYVHADPPEAKMETQEVPGSDGVVVSGVTMGEREVSLDCRAHLERWSEYDELLAYLGTLVGTNADLSVRSHHGQPFSAWLTSVKSGDRVGGTGTGEIFMTFSIPDPTRSGDTSTVSVTSQGGAVTFDVGGTSRAHASIYATVASDGTGALCLAFDGASYLTVPLSGDAPNTVMVDCEERTVKVNGVTSMITIESDWPELMPGEHTVSFVAGTGSATVTVTERWA